MAICFLAGACQFGLLLQRLLDDGTMPPGQGCPPCVGFDAVRIVPSAGLGCELPGEHFPLAERPEGDFKWLLEQVVRAVGDGTCGHDVSRVTAEFHQVLVVDLPEDSAAVRAGQYRDLALPSAVFLGGDVVLGEMRCL